MRSALVILLLLSTSGAQAAGTRNCAYAMLSPAEQRNPTLFYEAFFERNTFERNLFGWPLLEDSLASMRNYVARLPNRPEALLAEIETALRTRELTYGRFANMIGDLVNHMYRVRTGEDPVLNLHSDIAMVNAMGGLWLPIFQDTPLTQMEILRLSAAGIQPVQFVSRPTMGDGQLFAPDTFAEHDIGHGALVTGAMARRFSRLPVSALRDDYVGAAARRESHGILTPIVEATARIENPRLRADVTSLLFDFVHETDNRASTFLNHLRTEPTSHWLPMEFPEIPNESGSQRRLRYDAARQWLIRAFEVHMPRSNP